MIDNRIINTIVFIWRIECNLDALLISCRCACKLLVTKRVEIEQNKVNMSLKLNWYECIALLNRDDKRFFYCIACRKLIDTVLSLALLLGTRHV